MRIHTDTEGEQERPESGIFQNLRKKTISNKHPVDADRAASVKDRRKLWTKGNHASGETDIVKREEFFNKAGPLIFIGPGFCYPDGGYPPDEKILFRMGPVFTVNFANHIIRIIEIY